jgi:hypothetical protein
MEVYIGPPQGKPEAILRRQEVLEALAHQGLLATRTEERSAADNVRAKWILFFGDGSVSVQFQETEVGLVFATVEFSMFDASGVADQISDALEELGWETDDESVG